MRIVKAPILLAPAIFAVFAAAPPRAAAAPSDAPKYAKNAASAERTAPPPPSSPLQPPPPPLPPPPPVLQPPSSPGPLEPPNPLTPSPPVTRRNVAIAAAGVAVAGAAVAIVFGALALQNKSDYGNNPTYSNSDKGNDDAAYADGGLALAAAAGITSLVLFLTGEAPGPGPAAVTAGTASRAAGSILPPSAGGGVLLRF